MTNRPHIGIVSFYFPPSRASGVYRMLALANHLARTGWEVTVFTVTTDFLAHITMSSDETLLDDVDPAVRIERVPLPMAHLEQDIRRFGPFRGNYPELHRRVTMRTIRHVWGDQYGGWVPGLLRRMLTVHKSHPFDVTLATGNPYSTYQAVWTLKKLRGIPYVLDSRDSFTLNLFTGEPGFPPGHVAFAIEKRTFAGASAISFVNQPLLRWHQHEYPADADRMMVVANGYDPVPTGAPAPRHMEPSIEPGDEIEEPDGEAEPAGVRFGYVGTVTANQPHSKVWAGWERARESPDFADATAHLYGHLGFFGVSAAVRRVLPIDDRASAVTWHGAVGKAEIGDAYAQIDVLLMIVADSPYVTSGKVFEYMSTGKLVVGLYESDCAVADVLDDYPLLIKAASLSDEDIADALLAAARRSMTVTPQEQDAAREYAKRFERSVQLAPMQAALERIVAHRLPRGGAGPGGHLAPLGKAAGQDA
ncbi:MAG: glycosyltransferase [Micrococcales bacterium]|nr:glycosyltransferase [Micrococcales bacterium]